MPILSTLRLAWTCKNFCKVEKLQICGEGMNIDRHEETPAGTGNGGKKEHEMSAFWREKYRFGTSLAPVFNPYTVECL